MLARRLLGAAALAFAAAVACSCSGTSSDTSSTGGPPPPAGPTDDLPDTCNPLRANGLCLLPFPSAIFLDADASTKTGFRVHLGPEMFPKNTMGTPYQPTRWNLSDGFSPSVEILAYFPEPIDPASLPPIDDTAKSLAPGSATVIVDMDTGALVEHFAEIDLNATPPDDRQGLILRPTKRLENGARYAVAITNAIRTADGKVPASPPGWDAIMAGTATGATAKKQAARMPEIRAALAKAGVKAEDLVLAWDFVTASDEGLTRTMRSVRDQTLAQIQSGPLGYTITSVENDFSQHALVRVRGTFKTPKFLTSTDVAVAASSLTLDDNGDPVASGTYDAPFTVILPRSAQNGPVGLLLYGHGFLGSGEDELGDATGSYPQEFADNSGFALVATDWVGLSKYEGLASNGSQAAAVAVQDLNHLIWITDRLHQALANAIVLARTARDAIAKDPALQVNGKQVIDTSRIDYFGISLGGVMGSSLMAYSPDLERGTLHVGGAGWSTLIQRSLNWDLFKLVVMGAYPDKLDQQILIQTLQAHFDATDGISIAPHLLSSPLPGNAPKHVLLMMAVNDTQVPNLATECYARTLGLPLLSDSPLDIAGLTRTAGPLPSALTVWDLHEEAPPAGDVPPSVDTTNKVHTELRSLPAVQQQITQFERTGSVVSTCSGTCDPM